MIITVMFCFQEAVRLEDYKKVSTSYLVA